MPRKADDTVTDKDHREVLMKELRLRRFYKILVACVAAVVMLMFTTAYTVMKSKVAFTSALAVGIPFTLVYMLALFFAVIMPETDGISGFALAVLGFATLVFIRVCLVYYRSGDYNSFLVHWVEQMRGLSPIQAIETPIGDYNVPYLYVLLLISRIPVSDLVLIKAFSCVFDVLLAYSAALCARKLLRSEAATVLTLVLTAAVPTVVLNGAMWGQCDSVYAFFCVMTLYFILQKKGWLAMLFYSFAFSFKLQAIFLLPAIVICLFAEKLRPIHLVMFPAGFIGTALPALLCGRSFSDTFMIYFRQTQTYGSLDLNAPTVYRFVANVDDKIFSAAGVMLGGLVALCFIYFGFRLRDRIDDRLLVKLFFISALLIPYFLPRMHERYYFVADILSVLYFLVDRKRWYVPFITVFTSFVSYAYYLFGGITLVNYVWLSTALLILLIICLRDVYREAHKGTVGQ